MRDFNHNVLTVRNNHWKGIPYPASLHGANSNHGFKALKGRPESEIRDVPEARKLPELQDALVRLNAVDSPYFTVGCEKSFNEEANGKYWARGYLEFAANYYEMASEAQNYFAAFFHFDKFLYESQYYKKFNKKVMYFWEIEGAKFTSIDRDGFTASVWISTGILQDADEVKSLWCEALTFLVDFLIDISGPPRNDMQLIYESPSTSEG